MDKVLLGNGEMTNSFLIDELHAELFDGPKTLVASKYTIVRLAPGQHTLVLTSERPFMVAIIPSSEAGE
jgi:hypothetical protein